MTFSFSDLSQALRGGSPISAEDVLAARRWAWSDGGISPAEADTLFEINQMCGDPSPEWVDFFVEAIAEHVVNRVPPRGYVGEAEAAWLIDRIDRDGRVDSGAELELLVKIVETALNVPDALKSYVLRQIETIVLTGEGPTRRGGALTPGRIDEAEVAQLRRLLFAAGGDGATIVTRDEADLLWRLKDATLGADNAPGWKTLFVQAVGNHLMAHGSYRQLDRGEAERLEAFMGDHGSSVLGFLGRMAGSLAGGRREPARPAAPDHRAAVAASLAITPGEAAWLKERTEADGALDALEAALLDFVAAESGERPIGG